jgi:hypothetical protein
MSILHRALASPEPLPLDDAMLRRIERAYRSLEPDPLFRRRLRGVLINRYVADREGYLRMPRPRREMGKLGRAVLYASVSIAMTVSAAGAAADRSLPGDPLYGVKLQLEDIRMRIAPPSVRDDLAAMVLAERVNEVERLAAAGSWSLVAEAAARVSAAEEALVTIDPAAGGAASVATETLEAVMADAPPQAHAGLERALDNVASRSRARPKPSHVNGLRSDTQRPAPPAARPSPAPNDGDGEPKRRPPQARAGR